ncbi:MAG TPA: UDP binding domain-containing protein [Streptosporangiaceae bacterium]
MSDPYASTSAAAVLSQLICVPIVEEACVDADLVLHLTDWPQYRDIDPSKLRNIVRRPVLLDAHNTLPLAAWRAAGWTVRALGARIAQ